jgi:hypothetical protein
MRSTGSSTAAPPTTSGRQRNDATTSTRPTFASARTTPPPCTCQIHQGAGPDGSRGRYVEYTYHASDDNRDWAAVWWDDDISHPDGRAALNIRRPYDRADSDPAAPLRALWQSWGYRFTDE